MNHKWLKMNDFIQKKKKQNITMTNNKAIVALFNLFGCGQTMYLQISWEKCLVFNS